MNNINARIIQGAKIGGKVSGNRNKINCVINKGSGGGGTSYDSRYIDTSWSIPFNCEKTITKCEYITIEEGNE